MSGQTHEPNGKIATTEAWDADLSAAEARRLGPAGKRRRAETSFLRKVELLEQWGRDGLPPEGEPSVPWDRAKLRRWRDPSRHLWAWSDPQVDVAGGRNGGLAERFALAIKAVRVRTKGKSTDLKGQIEALEITVRSLELQNIRLLDQVRQLQRKVTAPRLVRR